MRQQVNLYGPSLLGPTARFSANRMGLVLVVAAALLVAAATWQQWRITEARGAAGTMQTELTALNAELERRAAALAAREPGKALLLQVERLERERAARHALLDRLEGEAMGNTRGFSAHLEGLGRQYPDGLWLRQVHLSAGGRRLGLEGGVTEAELLPRYLHALSREPAFAGTHFDSFSLHRSETPDGYLRFTLTTPCYDETGRRLEGADCPAGIRVEGQP